MNFPNVSPSHGLQLFTNYPSMGPSHRCSPSGTGCSIVGSPWGHRPCQQTCSGVGSSIYRSTGSGRSLLQHKLPMGSQLPSGIHLLFAGSLPRAASVYLLHRGSPWYAGVQHASPWSSAQAAREGSLLWHLEHLLPLLLH